MTTIPRLSEKEAAILALLEHGPLRSVDLVARSKGSLRSGTVYTTVLRMVRKGYVETVRANTRDGVVRTRVFATDSGLKVFRALQAASRYMAEGGRNGG